MKWLKRLFHHLLLNMELAEIADSEAEIRERLAAGEDAEAQALQYWIDECKGHAAAHEQRLNQLN